MERQHQEIAQYLVPQIESGRLLDIGTGPGRLLYEIRRLNQDIELFGLDISEAMVQLARVNLKGLDVNLLCGDIQQTDFADEFFDVITCTGSFYLWDRPERGLDEVFRILKRNNSAFLFETYGDVEKPQVQAALKNNLEDENLVRRIAAPSLFMRQLRMTYRTEEIHAIVQKTRFAKSYTIEHVSIVGVPAWLRIRLTKKL